MANDAAAARFCVDANGEVYAPSFPLQTRPFSLDESFEPPGLAGSSFGPRSLVLRLGYRFTALPEGLRGKGGVLMRGLPGSGLTPPPSGSFS